MYYPLLYALQRNVLEKRKCISHYYPLFGGIHLRSESVDITFYPLPSRVIEKKSEITHSISTSRILKGRAHFRLLSTCHNNVFEKWKLLFAFEKWKLLSTFNGKELGKWMCNIYYSLSAVWVVCLKNEIVFFTYISLSRETELHLTLYLPWN